MIVVDASVVFAAVADRGDDGERVRRRLLGEELHAPELVDLEVAEATRGRLLRGLLSTDQAWTAVDALVSLPIVRHSHTTLISRVWSLRDNLTSYDASYVALAERLAAVLVTADRRLGRAAGPRCRIDLVGA